MRKVHVILHSKKKPRKKDKLEDSSIKISENSSVRQGKRDKEPSTLGDISLELFEDLLKFKCKSFTNGVIIESLHSDFLKKINISLNTVLRAIGNAKYVHIILLSYTLENYIRDKEEEAKKGQQSSGTELLKKGRTSKEKSKKSLETDMTPKSSKKSKPTKPDFNEKSLHSILDVII